MVDMRLLSMPFLYLLSCLYGIAFAENANSLGCFGLALAAKNGNAISNEVLEKSIIDCGKEEQTYCNEMKDVIELHWQELTGRIQCKGEVKSVDQRRAASRDYCWDVLMWNKMGADSHVIIDDALNNCATLQRADCSQTKLDLEEQNSELAKRLVCEGR